jgi:hypothetical protein
VSPSAAGLLEPELRLLHIKPLLDKAHLARLYLGKGDHRRAETAALSGYTAMFWSNMSMHKPNYFP